MFEYTSSIWCRYICTYTQAHINKLICPNLSQYAVLMSCYVYFGSSWALCTALGVAQVCSNVYKYIYARGVAHT